MAKKATSFMLMITSVALVLIAAGIVGLSSSQVSPRFTEAGKCAGQLVLTSAKLSSDATHTLTLTAVFDGGFEQDGGLTVYYLNDAGTVIGREIITSPLNVGGNQFVVNNVDPSAKAAELHAKDCAQLTDTHEITVA